MALPEHWYGLRPPEGVKAAWGARALFEENGPGTFGLVWDRQSNLNFDQELHDELHRWLKREGFEALRQEILPLTSGEDTTVSIKSKAGKFTLQANPRASYGYLYMVAYDNPDEEDPEV